MHPGQADGKNLVGTMAAVGCPGLSDHHGLVCPQSVCEGSQVSWAAEAGHARTDTRCRCRAGTWLHAYIKNNTNKKSASSANGTAHTGGQTSQALPNLLVLSKQQQDQGTLTRMHMQPAVVQHGTHPTAPLSGTQQPSSPKSYHLSNRNTLCFPRRGFSSP